MYLVQEEGTGRLYAVKRIICHSKRDEQRVINEIGVHEKIGDHPNVLRCEGHSVEKLNSNNAVVAYAQQNGTQEVVSAVEYNLLLPYYKVRIFLIWNSNLKFFFSERDVIGRIDVETSIRRSYLRASGFEIVQGRLRSHKSVSFTAPGTVCT